MTDARYGEDVLNEDEYQEDDGTMPENVDTLRQAVIGHRIVKAEKEQYYFVITLDNGQRVVMRNSSDCCAYTDLEAFLLHPELVDHVIMGVGTTDGYQTWHIYADWGDVLELTVGWSAGNAFYYGYGFDIDVEDIPAPLPPPTGEAADVRQYGFQQEDEDTYCVLDGAIRLGSVHRQKSGLWESRVLFSDRHAAGKAVVTLSEIREEINS